jgi:hypothetical protein
MSPVGVTVQTRTAPPARGPSVDTGTAFLAAKVGSGSTTAPTLLRSLADFQAAYGLRSDTGNAPAYDWVDTFFREGGKIVYLARYTAGSIDNALALFTKGLGPGQVAAPEETPNATTFGKLLDHAAANNRFALLDVANGDTVAAETTAGGAIPAQSKDYGALFGPWVTIPPPATVIGGSARSVPASAAVAALCARVDALGNPNRAAAGRDFPLQYATGFARDLKDAEVETLLNVGVNSFVTKYGVLELYGFQTAVTQSADNPYWQANVGRLRMWIAANAAGIGETFMFRQIDGRGLLQEAFKQALRGMLLSLWERNGLYGGTPDEAFAVETGVAVNTTSSIAQGQLNAAAEIRPTLHAKSITIDLVTVPITGVVTSSAV